MDDVLTRDQIDLKYKWNTESIFPTREAWAAEVKAFADILPGIGPRFQGHLGDSPDVVADWFELNDSLSMRLGKIYVYAGLNQAVDTTDQASMALVGQAMGLYGQYLATVAFGDPELLALGEAKVRAWATAPRLATYAHYLDNLFRRQQHVRSAEVEETLGLMAEVFGTVGQTAQMLTDSDMKFAPAVGSTGEQKTVIQGTMDSLLADTDRDVRRTAWYNYCDTYLSLKNTLASNLLANVKAAVATSRVRRYNTALEASLFENNVPATVYHNLIETYKRNLPTWHRYWAVRRRALGVDRLQHWDIWAPLTQNPPNIPYERGVEMIAAGMAPLGQEYVETLRRGCLQDRWVDVFPNKGKSQGAFSSGVKGTLPFILISYDNKIGNVSTLAHELGHSLHSYWTWQHQPVVYSGYSMFVAETASNFNQAMVRAHLFQTETDRDFQLALIQEAMDNFHRYFFIMPTLARFELEVHTRVEQGRSPNADDLNALMADLFSEGYGSEMEIDREREGITWAQFGHLYANFYVFNYATGISAANALASRILEGTPGAPESYLKFLGTGSSLYPLDALKVAGVDMNTPEAVERTFGVLADLVDRLDRLTA